MLSTSIDLPLQSMASAYLSSMDESHLEKQNISADEIERQLKLLRRNTRLLELVRPCTLTDGIHTFADSRLPVVIEKAFSAIREGRVSDFIPASGAATRMFAELASAQLGECSLENFALCSSQAATGNKAAQAVLRLWENLRVFPFFDQWREAVISATGGKVDIATFEVHKDFPHVPTLLSALLDTPGLGLTTLPKALIAFHRYPDSTSRTAFEEHLVNAARTTKDKQGYCRIHFTISPEHHERFEELTRRIVPQLEKHFSCIYKISFSFQDSSTNAIALDLKENEPLRTAEGTLVLRPAGHGALLKNLAETEGDIVYLNNIDNVQPEGRKEAGEKSKLLLIGTLLELQELLFSLLKKLESPTEETLTKIISEVLPQIGVQMPQQPQGSFEQQVAQVRSFLDRPLRVCGMVKNRGEPGGGPHWVHDADGSVSCQIVEKDEVNPSAIDQVDIFKKGTHFNPVRLVCGLRDYRSIPFSLPDFANHDAVFTADKIIGCKQARILERPGLWNGAMAKWITIFVEIDAETFTPVKTIFDLIRVEHQTTEISGG